MVAGQVKIREVMFEYKSKVQKTTLNLAADNFVECLRKRVAYRRKPFLTPSVNSVPHEGVSGTECYKAKKGKGIADTEFLKLPEKSRPLRKAQPGMPPRARKSQPKSLQCLPKRASRPPKATQHHRISQLNPKATQHHPEEPRCHQKLFAITLGNYSA